MLLPSRCGIPKKNTDTSLESLLEIALEHTPENQQDIMEDLVRSGKIARIKTHETQEVILMKCLENSKLRAPDRLPDFIKLLKESGLWTPILEGYLIEDFNERIEFIKRELPGFFRS